MNEFLKMDIFFVIASASAIILTSLLVVILVYVIKFVRNLKYISDKARTETDNLTQDIQTLRGNIKTQGFKLKHLLGFFDSIINRKKTPRR